MNEDFLIKLLKIKITLTRFYRNDSRNNFKSLIIEEYDLYSYSLYIP